MTRAHIHSITLLLICMVSTVYSMNNIWCAEGTDKIILPFSLWDFKIIASFLLSICSGAGFFINTRLTK